MNAVTFNPATLLWRTRGRYWDYEFVAIPNEPRLGSWWDIFNQIFGGSPEPRKGAVHRYGELPGPQPRPFVAVAFSDAELKDEHGRPICHYLVWFPETEAGPAFERLRTGLPEHWPNQILNNMRPYFEGSNAFDLDEGKLQNMVKNDVKLGDYLIAQVQPRGKMQELKGFGDRTVREWKHVEITSPIPPKPLKPGRRYYLYAAAGAIVAILFYFFIPSPNPFAGTWTLDATKSQYESGDPPRKATCKIEQKVNGLAVSEDDVLPDGKPAHVSYQLELDGKEHPAPDVTAADTIAATLTKNTLETILRKGGQIVSREARVLSADQKLMTVTLAGVKPTEFKNITVYEKK